MNVKDKFYDTDIQRHLIARIKDFECVLVWAYVLTDVDIINQLAARKTALIVQRSQMYIQRDRTLGSTFRNYYNEYLQIDGRQNLLEGNFRSLENFNSDSPMVARGFGRRDTADMHAKTYVFGKLSIVGDKQLFIPQEAWVGSYNSKHSASLEGAYNHMVVVTDMEALRGMTQSFVDLYLRSVPIREEYSNAMRDTRFVD